MRDLILLGAPGAGKGTQGHCLSERYRIPQISTGDILRQNVRSKSLLGVKAKEYMDKGALVPDAVVVDMVAGRISSEDCAAGFILDGFPRNIAQARALDDTLKKLGRSISSVVGIEVERKELVRRLSGRRVCGKCGANYHLIFSAPVNIGVCDKCGSEIYQRDDDKEDTINARLKVYEDETYPLIEYYASMGLYKKVEGVGTVDDIMGAIVRVIEKGSDNT